MPNDATAVHAVAICGGHESQKTRVLEHLIEMRSAQRAGASCAHYGVTDGGKHRFKIDLLSIG